MGSTPKGQMKLRSGVSGVLIGLEGGPIRSVPIGQGPKSVGVVCERFNQSVSSSVSSETFFDGRFDPEKKLKINI